MEKLTFTINGHNFSTAIDTAVDREHCIEEILEVTGRHYSWYKENTGNKNWILYDTEQYEVKDFDSFELVVLGNRFDEVKEFLHVKEGFTGKLHLPINSSACSFLFTSTDTLKGDMIASKGDYIITGVDGEQYPCKPDIFEKTYEPVEN